MPSLTIRLDLGDAGDSTTMQQGPSPDLVLSAGAGASEGAGAVPTPITHPVTDAGPVGMTIPRPGDVSGEATAAQDCPPVPSPDIPGLGGAGAVDDGGSQELPRPEGDPPAAAGDDGGSQGAPQPQGEPPAKKRSAAAKKSNRT